MPERRSRRLVGARSTERRHPDAQVGDREAVQVPRPAARDLPGLRSPQRGEFALEAQAGELLDHAPADRVGDLVWPPFCMVVDWVVAAIIAVEIAAGMHFG
jgi:hypothetical protein